MLLHLRCYIIDMIKHYCLTNFIEKNLLNISEICISGILSECDRSGLLLFIIDLTY